MSQQPPDRFSRIIASVVAVALVVCAGLLLLARSAERSIEDACVGEMQGSVRLVADHIRGHLDEVAAELREVALGCGSSRATTVTDCAEILDRLRLREPALFVATMVLDRSGGVLATMPGRVWRADERLALEEARVRAGRAASPWGCRRTPPGRGRPYSSWRPPQAPPTESERWAWRSTSAAWEPR
jgi:hypothetical protein